MKEQKPKSLPRLIKVLLDIIFGMLIFVIAALVVWMILSPILGNRTDVLGTASIPVALGSGDEPRLEVSFDNQPKQNITNIYIELSFHIRLLKNQINYLLIY